MCLYRYVSSYLPKEECLFFTGEGKLNFGLLRFPVVKETRCGVWIIVYGKKKFVNTSAKKQYAYKTREEALKGYLARKHCQLGILKSQIEHTEAAIRFLEVNPGLPEAYPY